MKFLGTYNIYLIVLLLVFTSGVARWSYAEQVNAEVLNMIDVEENKYISNVENIFLQKRKAKDNFQVGHTKEILRNIFSVQMKKALKPVRTNPDILHDSKVIPDNPETGTSMLNRLFPGYTRAGEVFRELVLELWPTYDLDEIKHRQQIIQKTIVFNRLHPDTVSEFEKLKSLEAQVASFFDATDFIYTAEVQNIIGTWQGNTWYYRLFSVLVETTTDVLYKSAIASFLIAPFFCYEQGLCSRINNLISGIASIAASYYLTYLTSKLNEIYQQTDREYDQKIRLRTNALADFLKIVLHLNANLDVPEEIRLIFTGEEQYMIEEFTGRVILLASKDTSTNKIDITEAAEQLFGAIKLKDVVARILYHVGQLDTYLAIASRMECNECEPVSYARFVGAGPYVKSEGLWNPMIRGATLNDIQLGLQSFTDVKSSDEYCEDQYNGFANATVCTCLTDVVPHARNMVISGANASGKSTFMRAVLVNCVYLAQIFGVVAAESFEASLFHVVHSYMDKSDIAGKLSSYQAELKHASAVLKDFKNLPPEENALAFFDELFSTTDTDNGLRVSKVVLQALAECKQAIALISTHYYFGDFFQDKQYDYALKHMHVEESTEGIVFTYKIKDGVNSMINACQIMLNNFKDIPSIYSELKGESCALFKR